MEVRTAMKGKSKISRTGGEVTFNVINYIIFGLFTLLCIYPFYYLIINSISANNLSAAGKVLFYPMQVQFSNFIQVFSLPGLGHAALISVARTVLGTICTTAVSTYLGYMFTKEKMWHRKFWYRFILITMYFNAGVIPLYLTYRSLGLLNNFLVYILPWLIQPFFIMLTRAFVESTPSSLQESAEIDGAGTMTIFMRIMVPLLKPIIATIAIFCAVNQWNSFMDTVIYVTDSRVYTLQYILYSYLNQVSSLANMIRSNMSGSVNFAQVATQATPTSVQITVTVIVILPILIVYPYFQRFFIKGIMIGAVKG